MKTKNIFHIFEQLEDPRIEKKTKHRLVDIIGIAVCAVLVGSETFEDIELYGHSKKEWLEQYLELKNGIPSHDTFRRVFSLISPTLFQSLFSEWIRLIFGETLSEHVAIDGKSLNLEEARRLALMGKSSEAAALILDQVGSTEDLMKMGVIQQQALAKAVGMERNELIASVKERETLEKIGGKSVKA